jgi:predicted nucleotidyltransferase component of viral defense system
MISRFDIEQRVREWGLREDVVEKDYVIGWVLWGIGRQSVLRDHWAFKGGTSLKKCFIETYRFSEDLDFTVLPGGPVRADDVRPLLLDVLNDVAQNSGIDFSRRVPLLTEHSSGAYTEGRVYYVGPRNTPQVASIRLDLSASEVVVRPTMLRNVAHPYPDAPRELGTVRCYSFEEVFAEKIRAMGERGRPRDLYDIVNLYRQENLIADPSEIRSILLEKCDNKKVLVPTLEAVLSTDARAELESEWSNMLGHQLPQIPPLDDFIDELGRLFSWLEGAVERPRRPAITPYAPAEDSRWLPPPTVQTWGFAAPLETIRFAAVNHLLVELEYGGRTRLIEPYSLRRTRDDNLVLHANRANTGEHRSYRVDRIQSARATSRAFLPRYAIEFSSAGPFSAPPAFSTPAIPRSSRSRRARRRNDNQYRIECPVCGKRFTRSKPGNTKLNKHKTPNGYRCSGSGRRGYQI